MLRRRIRKIKTLNNIAVICIITIAVLNIIGISYGVWSDHTNIKTSISTGTIKPCFCDEYMIDKKNGDGEITVNFQNDNIMIIEGKVKPGYKTFVYYCVTNEGTIPIEYEQQNCDKYDYDGLKLILNQSSDTLQSYDDFGNETWNSKLHIEANTVGTHTFEIPLLFKIPGVYNSWEKTLIIKGNIEVEQPKVKNKVLNKKSTIEELNKEEDKEIQQESDEKSLSQNKD